MPRFCQKMGYVLLILLVSLGYLAWNILISLDYFGWGLLLENCKNILILVIKRLEFLLIYRWDRLM